MGTANDYRSKFEAKVATYLTDRQVQFTYETYSYQYEEPLRKNQSRCGDCESTNLVRVGWYTPDFFLSTGYIIESKGRFTAADRRKMIAIKKDHPDLKIVMLFMRDNKIHKNSSTYYSDWCMENGYEYAIGTPQEAWLNEQS